MDKIVILDGKTLGNVEYVKLNEFGQVTYYDVTKKEDVADRIKEADIVLTNKVILDESNLKDAGSLKLICETATGFNNIDIEYCRKNKIAVANVSGYSTNTVAQHTLAMFLSLNNKLNYFDNFVKSGEYAESGLFTNLDVTFNDLGNKIWGIVGLGAIGKRTAKLAQAFGARVVYYSTSGKNDNSDYARVDFDKLLKESDVISIHAPLNDKTKGLFDYKAIKKMKSSAVLINTGRGGIVSEEGLVQALNEDLIAGAALDVYAEEPLSKESLLLNVIDKNKIILTPHIAWASEEARKRLFEGVLENIEAFKKGERKNRID